jgi:hypothetical protein
MNTRKSFAERDVWSRSAFAPKDGVLALKHSGA